MNDFALFDVLPNGVIVFKDKKILFMNKHLKDVLSIGYLSRENAIDIIAKMLSLKSEEDIFHFFSNHDYFTTQNKFIQINHSRHDEYDIYQFTSINSSLIKEKADVKTAANKVHIDENVAKHFKINNIQKIKVLTFYKGVPLSNIGKIIRINTDSIEIIVDSKHHISLLERDDIILISDTKKGATVLHGHVVKSENNIFVVKKFNLTKDDMHLRNGLRVKPDIDMIVNVNKQEFKVYDISESGISIFIKTIEEENLLKDAKSIKILFNNEELRLNARYLKTISENGKILKIIFNISAMGDATLKISQYIVNKQNEILREIHEYQKN